MLQRFVDLTLRRSHHARRLPRELPGEFINGPLELGAWHDAVDEADPERLLRRERTARQHQLAGEGWTDLADEPWDAAPRQRDAQVDLGDREHGVVGGDSQVAHTGEHHAATDARALDGRDRHRRHAIHRLGHQSTEVGLVATRRSVRVLPVTTGELSEIEPR